MKKNLKNNSLIALIISIVFVFTNFSTAFAKVENKTNTTNLTAISKSSNIDVKEAINKTSQYMVDTCKELKYGKEWYAIGLSRAGFKVPDGYYENYYNSVVEEVNDEDGEFSKVTDLERIILALNSIGKDPTSVGEHNLIDNLWNYENITNQGLNGPVFALLALDSKKYEEPKNAVNTRDSLIKNILEFKTDDGGFSLFKNSKNADVDMTAMTLQALSNYMNNEEVKKVVQSSLKVLSKNQLDNGGYKSEWSGENVQSPAQVIVALTALGKDIMDPSNGFVKKDGNLLSYVMTYQNKTGAFEHPKGKVDSMATEQVMYTLVSYDRFVNKKNKLYDMSDEKTSNPSINVKEAINKTSQYMLNTCKELKYGKEWYAIGLSRAGFKVPDGYYENYYNSVVEEVNDEDGEFSKVTDLERIILALNAIGKDSTKVGDYNLVDLLWNYEDITKQGLNGPVFALLALDSKKYKEPENAVNTRKSLIENILEFKTDDGGFSLFKNSKNADVDMTAMTLQALSNYMDNSKVKEVVESSLNVLSQTQLDNGGYKSEWSGENVQSPAQVIVALTALGKDIMDPSNGFVKKDGNLLSYVMTYQNKTGAFEHPKGKVDSMATEQAMYTLVSYDRFVNEKNKLYDMNDQRVW